MYLKALTILFCFLRTVISTSICLEETPCRCVKSGETIDLSSIASESTPRFYEVQAENATFPGLYSYNPCLPFNSPDRGSTLNEGNVACKDAAGCVKTPGGLDSQPPEEHAIGIQSTAQFGSTIPLGLHINYSTPGATQKLIVRLICDESVAYHLSIDSPETVEEKTVVMNLTSKCACPNGCPATSPPAASSGLSTGSKLLISFFTITLAYFVVGIVWNCFNGHQGIEVVPNLDFWNDLPKLIIEGVTFTCTCFGKKSSYGEV